MTFKDKKQREDESNQNKNYATTDAVDGKIQMVLEKLKNDNQLIWKESIELAEKQFNEKGIRETMDLLPTNLQGLKELKSTINILDNTYKNDTTKGGLSYENQDQPRPVINITDK